MAITTPSTKTDSMKSESLKTDVKSGKSSRSIDTKASPLAPDARILQRLIPSARRITYQFDTSDFRSHSAPNMQAVAFEQQNDRESEAECDALIEQAIREEWSKAGFSRFRFLRVEVHSGHVKLQGRLHCYYHKQMAHSLIRNVHGIRSIENDIQVHNEARQSIE